MFNFKNKVVLITGAGSGIGRATAMEFSRMGAHIVIADITEQGEETRDLIHHEGNNALFVKIDVSKSEDHQKLLSEINTHYGKLDYACNNAGIEQPPTKLADVDEAAWDKIININLKGVWLGMKYQIPYLLKNNQGTIINTASVAALKAVSDIGVYNCSKAGVVMLTKTAALDYAKENIRINAICPGLVMTDMAVRMSEEHPEYFKEKLLDGIPMGRGAAPDEIAKIILWLCSDQASFITGQCITADGGWLA